MRAEIAKTPQVSAPRSCVKAARELSLKGGVSILAPAIDGPEQARYAQRAKDLESCRRAAPARTSQSSGSKFRCSCRPA